MGIPDDEEFTLGVVGSMTLQDFCEASAGVFDQLVDVFPDDCPWVSAPDDPGQMLGWILVIVLQQIFADICVVLDEDLLRCDPDCPYSCEHLDDDQVAVPICPI